MSNFQTGITYRSYLRWSRENRSTLGFLYDLCLCAPLAYLVALRRSSYEVPKEFRGKGRVDERIVKETVSLPALASEHGFELDRCALSERAEHLYYLD